MEISTQSLLALLVIALIWYVSFQRRRRRLYELAAHFTGPRPLPIIGNFLNCLIQPKDMTEKILKATKHYKSPTKLWFGPYLIINLWDPQSIKIVLNSPHALGKEKFMYKLLASSLGRGLSVLPVDEWKRHRRLIAPMFNRRNVDNFFDTFSKHSNRLVEILKERANDVIFDTNEELVKYSMDSTLDVLLDETANDNTSSKIGDALQKILTASVLRMTKIWLYFDFVFNLSSYGREVSKVQIYYNSILSTIIQKWETDSVDKCAVNDVTERKRPIKFIEHLMSISDGSGKFTLEELRGEISLFIGAGIETTSSTLGFALLMLGLHPDIQEKAYQEIKEVLGYRTQLSLDDVKKLEYLERVIKEVMRLYPGAAGTGRYAEEEIQLENHTIPAKSTIIIGILPLHRDPNIWPDPLKFDPDRFLPEMESKRHPYSWIPFSAGPRNCIGMTSGLLSLKTSLSTFLLNYKVSTNYKSVEDIHLSMAIALKPTNGVNISLTTRQI